MGQIILVADDSATIQKVIKIAFSRFPVSIIEASSYQEALKLALKDKPNLVIADANLTGVKSQEEFLALQAKCDHAPILMLAGSYEHVDEDGLLQHGLKHILKKPFDTNELVRYVSEELRFDFYANAPSHAASEPPVNFTGSGVEAESHDVPPVPEDVKMKQSYQGHENFVAPSIPTFQQAREVQPIVDTEARGKKAFEDLNLEAEKTKSTELPRGTLAASPDEMANQIRQIAKEELASLVRASVVDYCREHFPDLARDVLVQELRRLADEKSQLLMDS